MSTFSPAGYEAVPSFGGNVQQVSPEITAAQMAALEGAVVINRSNIVPPAGKVFYVEANAGVDTQDGLSWDNALKTLAVAFAASNVAIAAADKTGYAARNRIYYRGDNNEAAAETLTTLPSKCDVIGVGSYDHKDHPWLIGNHVIGGETYMGTRFFNMGFRSPAAGGVIFTAPTTTSGLKFYGCQFDGDSTTKATIGLLSTSVESLEVIGSEFKGKFSTAAISIGAGIGLAMHIWDNLIESGAIGIAIDGSYTCAAAVGSILINTFMVGTFIMDDDSNKVQFGDNRGSTETDGKLLTSLDYNANLAWNNWFSCSGGTVSQYPVLTSSIPS